MNRLIISGNLTRDPESRVVQTSNGDKTVVALTVAVNEGLALQLRIRIEQEEAKHKARIEILREWLDYETKRTAG